ncbi:MAG TPA: sugar transferase [Acidimicrobiia bacterium]
MAVGPDLRPDLSQLDRARSTGRWLRRILFGLDVAAVALAWLLTLVLPAVLDGSPGADVGHLLLEVLVVVVASLAAIAWQDLYRARVCSVRAIETARLGRAAVLSGIVGLIVSSRVGAYPLALSDAILASVVTFVLLVLFRGLYGSALRRGRKQGRFCRPVVVVGTGDEGYELYRLLELHPELGFRVAGVVGARAGLSDWEADVPWLGDLEDTEEALQDTNATGVLIAASDLGTDDLNRLSRELVRSGVHVHLSSGLRGIAHRRLRAMPLAHEPLFYLEPASLSRWQYFVKRAIDIGISSVLLLVSLPVLLISALALKLQDGGPVFFRQVRVGRDGEEFTLYKLRTMVPDAEERLVDLTFTNERQGGPLFKLAQDPRRTKVGRLLERASIDELPQLINVLRGEMSIVGPRPALPHEVAQFDQELLDRHSALPGITGLWQVEGRDNPAFDVYRRLDLFYVENWSVGLDVAIMLGTVQVVMGRVLRSVFARGSSTPVHVAANEAVQ